MVMQIKLIVVVVVVDTEARGNLANDLLQFNENEKLPLLNHF